MIALLALLMFLSAVHELPLTIALAMFALLVVGRPIAERVQDLCLRETGSDERDEAALSECLADAWSQVDAAFDRALERQKTVPVRPSEQLSLDPGGSPSDLAQSTGLRNRNIRTSVTPDGLRRMRLAGHRRQS